MPDRGDQARGTRLRGARGRPGGALASRATFNRTGKAPGGLPATTTLTPHPKRSPRPEARGAGRIRMGGVIPLPLSPAQLGLGLLLQPSATSKVARVGCVLVGALGPAYRTYRALQARSSVGSLLGVAPESVEETRLLHYWTVYGCLSAAGQGVEQGLAAWFPWYYHAKVAFLLWLQTHPYQGATTLYNATVKPLLQRYEPQIDAGLKPIESQYAAFIADNRQELARAAGFVGDMLQASRRVIGQSLKALADQLQKP